MFRKTAKDIGSCGEDAAVSFLKKNKYKIVSRNFAVHNMGEIDIIAKDGEYTVFVEVKTRKSTDFGRGSEAVDYFKQQRIKKTALFYAKIKGQCFMRFDIIEVYGESINGRFEIENIVHIKNAF